MRTVIPEFKGFPEVIIDPEEGKPVAPQPNYGGGDISPLDWNDTRATAVVPHAAGGEGPTDNPHAYNASEDNPDAGFFTGTRGARIPEMPPDPVRTREQASQVYGQGTKIIRRSNEP